MTQRTRTATAERTRARWTHDAGNLDRHLVHFLELRSYVKALAFVVDGEVPE